MQYTRADGNDVSREEKKQRARTDYISGRQCAPRPGHTHYSSSEYYLLSFSPFFVAKTNQTSFGKEVGDGDNVDEPPATAAVLVPLMRALCSPAYRGKIQISLSRTTRSVFIPGYCCSDRDIATGPSDDVAITWTTSQIGCV